MSNVFNISKIIIMISTHSFDFAEYNHFIRLTSYVCPSFLISQVMINDTSDRPRFKCIKSKII